MKKLSLLFAFLAVLAAFGSVFAQVGAPLDLTTAEPFLGTWFISELCGEGQCVDAAMWGMSGMSVEFTDDATMLVAFNEEEQDAMPWYTENGAAYACSGSEESDCTWLPLSLTEDGKLSMGDEASSMLLTRDEIKPFGTAEVKADAAYEDFQGEWFLESMISEGATIPASLFGMQAKLVIREDSLDYSLTSLMSPEESLEQENTGYEIKDGTLTVVFTNGEEPETVTMHYHLDDSIVASMEDGNLVFVREENLSTGPSLMDLFSQAMTEGEAAGNEVEIGTTGFRITIPEDYTPGELTEEDIADDQIAYYRSEINPMDFDIYQFPAEGQTYIDYARSQAAEYGVNADDVEDWQVNGIDIAKYHSTEEFEGKSFPCVTWIFEAGDDLVEIGFWLDGEGAEDLSDQIIFSLTK